jgi:hypothetical protein
VFIGPRVPLEPIAENGHGWLLRSYPSLQGLSPLVPPAKMPVRTLPVRWHLSVTEAPQWDDAVKLHDLTEFSKQEKDITRFFDHYTQYSRTKIGGWPSYIQGSVGSEDYVFQIGSEQKPGWMWGDDGNGYFFLRDGKWFLYWDCY